MFGFDLVSVLRGERKAAAQLSLIKVRSITHAQSINNWRKPSRRCLLLSNWQPHTPPRLCSAVMFLQVFTAEHIVSSKMAASCSLLVKGYQCWWLVKVQSHRKLKSCLMFTQTHTHTRTHTHPPNHPWLRTMQTKTSMKGWTQRCTNTEKLPRTYRNRHIYTMQSSRKWTTLISVHS